MNMVEQSLQFVNEGKYEEALQLLKSKLPKADMQTKFEGGLLLLEWGHVDEAQKIFESLHKKNKHQNMIISVLMQIYFMQDQEDDAFKLLETAKQNAEGYEDILLTMADYYFGMGLYEVAEQKLLEAYDIKQDSIAVLFALTEYYEQIDDMGMRIHFLKKLKEVDEDFSDEVYALQLAMAYMDLGKYEEALVRFEQVPLEKMEKEVERFYYGLCLFFHERYEAAIPLLKEAMKSNETLKKGTSYLAHAYIQLHQFHEARQVLETHIEKFPEDEGILQMLANLYIDEKNHHKAKTVVEKLLILNDENFEAFIQYVWILENEGDYEGIVQFVEEKLKAGIEISELYWILARAYVEIESYEQALKPYEMAYNGLHDEIDFLLDYGQFLVEEGQKEKAIQIYKQALNIDSTNEQVNERLQSLTWDEF